jgi:hypothetical protein
MTTRLTVAIFRTRSVGGAPDNLEHRVGELFPDSEEDALCEDSHSVYARKAVYTFDNTTIGDSAASGRLVSIYKSILSVY